MDTEKLVVGQYVRMVSGCYGSVGKVVKVTPLGVDVLIPVDKTFKNSPLDVGVHIAEELVHFDKNGCSYVTELPSFYDPKAHPQSPWRWDGNGTFEGGPWLLDETSFEELNESWEPCANCEQPHAHHNPNHESYDWYRKKGVCEHFKAKKK